MTFNLTNDSKTYRVHMQANQMIVVPSSADQLQSGLAAQSCVLWCADAQFSQPCHHLLDVPSHNLRNERRYNNQKTLS
jgi:hypothetical protein